MCFHIALYIVPGISFVILLEKSGIKYINKQINKIIIKKKDYFLNKCNSGMESWGSGIW